MDRRPDPTTNEDDEEGPGRLRSETSMNVKRILKQPLMWVLLVFVGLMLALNLTSDTEYQRVDTSQAVQLINGGQVSKAEFTGDDRIDLERQQSTGAQHLPRDTRTVGFEDAGLFLAVGVGGGVAESCH